jgi:hypothetical protein
MHLVRHLSFAALCTLGLLLSATGVQAQAMKLLPADTEMVFTINLQQMLKSDVVKSNDTLLKLLKQQIDQQLEDKGVAKYFEKAKFDLFKDLSSITVAVPGGKEAAEGLVIIEGNFEPERIEEVAGEVTKEAGGSFKVSKIANVKAFEITPKDEKTVYIGVLNKKTIIVTSTKADFTAAVGRSTGAKAGFKSESFKNLIATVSPKQSISFAATSAVMEKMSEKAPEGGAGDQVKQAVAVLKQFDGFSGAITIEKNIDFQIGANAKSKETATEYSNLIKVGLGAAKAKIAEQAKNNEKFGPVVDIVNSLTATTQGANIIIRGQITLEQLGKLLQNLPVQQ